MGADSLISGNGGIAGVARLMARVLSEEAAQGHLNLFCETYKDPLPVKDLSINVRTAASSRLKFIFNLARRREASHFFYDSCNMSQAHPAIPGLNRPFLVFIHGVEVWEDAKTRRIKSARNASTILANSVFTARRAEACHGGFLRAKVCWLATNTDEPGKFSERRSSPPSVLIVARLCLEDMYKGHAELINAWPRVIEKVPDAVLNIVGTGSGDEQLKKLAAQKSCSEKINFLGFVNEESLDELYARSSVFAMPSRGEGFGLVYIEAMRHGLPVIASIHDAAQEINIDGETGYNVNLDKPDELPERLIALLKNRDLAQALGQRGQTHWQSNFCFSAFQKRFLPLLTEFLNQDSCS